LAYGLAQQAQSAYQFELGRYQDTFLQLGYWDSPEESPRFHTGSPPIPSQWTSNDQINAMDSMSSSLCAVELSCWADGGRSRLRSDADHQECLPNEAASPSNEGRPNLRAETDRTSVPRRHARSARAVACERGHRRIACGGARHSRHRPSVCEGCAHPAEE